MTSKLPVTHAAAFCGMIWIWPTAEPESDAWAPSASHATPTPAEDTPCQALLVVCLTDAICRYGLFVPALVSTIEVSSTYGSMNPAVAVDVSSWVRAISCDPRGSFR